MMYPGEVGKAAYRTVWNGEEIVESTKMLDDGELRYDRTMKPIVFQGVLDCPVSVWKTASLEKFKITLLMEKTFGMKLSSPSEI